MPDTDKYTTIASLYEAMIPQDDKRSAFFNQIFQQHKVRTVLDCACGTGNDLLMFHSLGYKISGSDLSESMLAVAAAKLQARSTDLSLDRVDFQKLHEHYKQHFDAIVCLTNSINEIEVDAKIALKSMLSILNPRGIIVFDQGQTDFSLQNPPLYAPIVNSRDLSRLFTMTYDKDVMTVQTFDFVHNETQHMYDFMHSEFKICLRLKADWDRILNSVNLKAEYYGSWNAEPYDIDKSTRMIIVATAG